MMPTEFEEIGEESAGISESVEHAELVGHGQTQVEDAQATLARDRGVQNRCLQQVI